MNERKIIYPDAQKDAQNDGVTPEMEQARKLGLLEPMEDTLEWLDIKADIHLKYNDRKAKQPKEQSEKPTNEVVSDFEEEYDEDEEGDEVEQESSSQSDRTVIFSSGHREPIKVRDPHKRSNLESKFAIDRGLLEARRLREINNTMENEIANMLIGYDVDIFRTPNQEVLASIREELVTAYQQDPQVDNRELAKERVREIIELEKKLSDYLQIFGQEVQDIISGQ